MYWCKEKIWNLLLRLKLNYVISIEKIKINDINKIFQNSWVCVRNSNCFNILYYEFSIKQINVNIIWMVWIFINIYYLVTWKWNKKCMTNKWFILLILLLFL